MMKRSVLAVAVSLIVVTTGANAVEIYNKDGNQLDLYGRVNGKHYFSDNKSNNGDGSYMRFGFKGQTKISDTLTGYGQWEYQNSLANSEGSDAQSGNKTRLGFAGLKFAKFGSLDYGRNYGVVYDAIGYTDMLPEYGGDSANTDNFMVGRSSSLATYRNKNFFGLVDGLHLALQYQAKNEATSSSSTSRPNSRSNGDGYGASLTYEDIGGTGIAAVIAGSRSDRTNAQSAAAIGGGSEASAWSAAVKYDANQIYLATMVEQTHKQTSITANGISGYANKTQIFEAVAQYQFLNGFRPSLGYVTNKAKDVEGVGDAYLYKYVSVGAYYYFNKNMYTYVDYKINTLSNSDSAKLGGNKKDVTTVSLTYRF
ncbi:porin OmpC [Serratia sp. M24T3]|uniref:Porin OmpC n=1 Tax=Rouxiella sp. WC2420 TaxID=3234145 RepID=A0AB39VLD6_9GAMM|nr:porin OmpC [Serratia sp. M24T3]EIC85861.1 porin [Serratia sp. M24T3]